MGRHLKLSDVEGVVNLLDGWSGKLTWGLLSAACGRRLGLQPTRQTLARCEPIRTAFKVAKDRIGGGGEVRPAPMSLRIACDRIQRVEAELSRVVEINRQLIERFVIWQYNAYTFGMTDRDLDKELPKIDRGATEVKAH